MYFKQFCFVNPYKSNQKGKELCDVLFVWGDVVFLYSIKTHKLKGKYDRQKKMIQDGIKQLTGVHRNLSQQSQFLVKVNGSWEEVSILDYSSCRIHRIILTLGDPLLYYHAIERDAAGNAVHVFDREAFDALLNEFDTLPDLDQYLKSREVWMENIQLLIAPRDVEEYRRLTEEAVSKIFPTDLDRKFRQVQSSGHELDLAAAYLRNNRAWPDDFTDATKGDIQLDYAGEWDLLNVNPKFINRNIADRDSRAYDDFIRDVLEKPELVEMGYELSTLNRYDRRLIAQQMHQFWFGTNGRKEDEIHRRYIPLHRYGLLLMHSETVREEEVNKRLLEHAVQMYAYQHNLSKMIVILSDPMKTLRLYLYWKLLEPFTEEERKEIASLIKEYQWFTNEKSADRRSWNIRRRWMTNATQ